MSENKLIKTYIFLRKQNNYIQSFYQNFFETMEKSKLIKVVKVKHIK